MVEMPQMFKSSLRKDTDYKDCSLICISAVNEIFLIKINHFRLDFDKFWETIYQKTVEDIGANCVSWGQTRIDAPSR